MFTSLLKIRSKLKSKDSNLLTTVTFSCVFTEENKSKPKNEHFKLTLIMAAENYIHVNKNESKNMTKKTLFTDLIVARLLRMDRKPLN